MLQQLEEFEVRLCNTDMEIMKQAAILLGEPDKVLYWGPNNEPVHECSESPVGYCLYADGNDDCVICGDPFDWSGRK